MQTKTVIGPERANFNLNGAADLDLPNLIDAATLAAHLGLTVRTVRRKVAAGQIPFLKLGHLIRFDAREIKAWLDQARSLSHGGPTISGQNGARP